MNQEMIFWQKILDYINKDIPRAAREYYVSSEEKLLKIENDVAFIYLSSQPKEFFWQNNINPIILAAGFEVFGKEIKTSYLFELPEDNEELLAQSQVLASRTSYPPSRTENMDTGLLAQYVFENFIQGEGNRMAIGAAVAVSYNKASHYNPLFIYGGPGLGKTHLVNAIGNEFLHNFPGARVKYISIENFLNDFTKAIRLEKMEEFRNTYRQLDLLIVDDVQFLSLGTKKVETEKELFNIFNDLHQRNSQIVLTSDRKPDDLDNLDDRLRTRFSWGTTTDITPPDFETRLAILQSKVDHVDLDFKPETLEYLAGQFVSNVRELEGAIHNIQLLADIDQIHTITIEVAAKAIKANKQNMVHHKVISIGTIQEEVAKFYGVSVTDIVGKRRLQNIVQARQIAMYLARELTDNSLPKIGKEFGGKDHTTVMHSYDKIGEAIENDPNLRLEIEELKKKIQ